MASSELNDEIEAQLRRFSVSTNSGFETDSGGIDTPLSSSENDVALFMSDKRLVERWEEALQRCRQKLKPSEYHAVSQYDTPQKLLVGLEKLQAEHLISTDGISRLIAQIYPTSQSFRDTVTLFVGLMLPRTIATGFLWGVFYLIIKLSVEHDATSKRVANMLIKLRRQLSLLIVYARKIKDTDQIRLAVIDVFENLIYFWVDCVSHFRLHPPRISKVLEWGKLDQKFQNTLGQIDDALEHLKALLPLNVEVETSPISTDVREPGTFPVHLLPGRGSSCFIGRDVLLQDIETYFQNSGSSDQPTVCTISGLGGVGKTELALQYCQKHLDIDVILWARSEKSESLKYAFTKFALELQLPGANFENDPDHNLDLVHHWFRTTEKRWLLVFDNVERYIYIKRFISFSGRGSILLTTRYETEAKLAGDKHVLLCPLGLSDARSLFSTILEIGKFEDISANDQEAANYLLSEMDGIVLGIQQIATFIKFRDQQHDIAGFTSSYRKNPHRIHGKAHGIEGHTLNTLWKMTFDHIKANPSFEVLGVIACFGADDIPRKLLFSSDCDHEVFRDEFEVDEALDELKAVGLIERNKVTLGIHRLIQASFVFYLEKEQRQKAFNAATMLLNHVFPKQFNGRPLMEQWQQCVPYIDHGIALAALYAKLGRAKLKVTAPEDLPELLSNCAWYLMEIGSHESNLELLEIAFNTCSDKESLWYAHMLNSAFCSHFEFNDLKQARETLEGCREIREKLLESDHEELANTYHNLGCLETAVGNTKEALEHLNRSIQIQQLIPDSDRVIAVSELCIGRALLQQGDYPQCRKHFDIALGLLIKTVGPEGYSIAGMNYARGNLEAALQNFKVAKELYESCLKLLLRYTPIHVKVPATYFKIGCVELELKNYLDAMTALQNSLKVARFRGELGESEVARALHRQAIVLERASKSLGSSELSALIAVADLPDAESLRGESERLRRKLGGSQDYQISENECEEAAAYNNLVSGFHR